MPPEFEALLKAWQALARVGPKPLCLSYTRQAALRDAHSRGITPDDVTLVMKELNRLIDHGVKGYSDTSLAFWNVMQDVDKLEERAARIRQRIARAKGSTPKPDVQHERQVGDVKFRVLGPPESGPPDESANVLPGALRELAKGLERRAS